MTDDELLKLETAAIQSIDGELRGPALKAAARIRELEGEVIHWKYETSSANARIRELVAEIEWLNDALQTAPQNASKTKIK